MGLSEKEFDEKYKKAPKEGEKKDEPTPETEKSAVEESSK
jgi:hypothetical protein